MREPLLRIRFLTRVVVVMLSMVRAILYRMVKSPSNWAYTCAMVGCSCILAFAIWLSQQPSLGLGSIIEGNLSQMSILQIFGYSFVSGSFISMLAGVYIASFFSADFKTGYIKNYIQASGGRFAYLVAAVIASLVAVIWFMVRSFFYEHFSVCSRARLSAANARGCFFVVRSSGRGNYRLYDYYAACSDNY